MRASFELLETDASISKKIYAALIEEINLRLKKGTRNTNNKLREFVRARIEAQPEWASLKSDEKGSLKGHFGLANPDVVMEPILDAFINSITVTIKPLTNFSSDAVILSINLIEADFSDVLGLTTSSYISTNSRGGSYLIEWLKNLLLDGATIIVREYAINFNLNSVSRRSSRSGQALMVKRSGASWQVPDWARGTLGDNSNFVSRAFHDSDKEFEKIIEGFIEEIF